MKRKSLCSQAAYLCAFLVISASVFSATSYVENISFTMPETFYYYNGDFQIDTTGAEEVVAADVQAYGGGYDYRIDGATLQFSACDLIQDRSIPGTVLNGQAIGDFEGGATLRLSGDLTDVGTGGILSSGVLLESQMRLTDAEVWTLQESSALTSILSATFLMDPTGGALSTGVAVNGDTLTIDQMTVQFTFVTMGVENFDNALAAAAPHIQIAAAIPEPATIALLGLGAFVLKGRKK